MTLYCASLFRRVITSLSLVSPVTSAPINISGVPAAPTLAEFMPSVQMDDAPRPTQINQTVTVAAQSSVDIESVSAAAAKVFEERNIKNPVDKLDALEENLKFLEQVRVAIIEHKSLKFAEEKEFDAQNLPKPSKSLMELAVYEFNPEAIALLYRLDCEYLKELGKIIATNMMDDANKKARQRLDKYPRFVLAIIRQNGIRPAFLHEYYINNGEFSDRQGGFNKAVFPTEYHFFLLNTIRDAFDLTPQKMLSRYSLADIKTLDVWYRHDWLLATVNISQKDLTDALQRKKEALPKEEAKGTCIVQ